MEDNTKNTPAESSTKHDKKEKKNEKNFFVEQFQIFRAEFRKIVWPSRREIVKQTVTVIVISLIFGAYIAAMDGIFSQAFSQFVRFFG